MPPPNLVLPAEATLPTPRPTVSTTTPGEREPLSKSPFLIIGLAALQADVVEVTAMDTVAEVACKVDGCRGAGTSETTKFPSSDFGFGHK